MAGRLITQSVLLAGTRRYIHVGDSRGRNAYFSDAANASALSRGILNVAKERLRQRFRFNPAPWDVGGDTYAVSGYTSTQVVANGLHTAAVASHATDPIAGAFILVSINDRADVNQLSFATTIANLQTINDTFAAAGIPRIWLDEMPAGDASHANWASNGQLKIHHAVSQWLRSRNGLPGERTISCFGKMVDNASAVSAPVAALFEDQLHPNFIGADAVSILAAALIEPDLPQCDVLPSGPADLFDPYNATTNPLGPLNPTGCLNSNPFMLGNSGTINAGIVPVSAGVNALADNWTANLSGGGTGGVFTLSKYTHTDGTIWQKLALSGTATATGTITIEQPSVGANLVTGDLVDIVGEIMVDAGQTGLNAVSLSCFDGGATGGAKNRRDMWRVNATDLYPTVARRGVQRIPRFAVATAGTMKPQVTVAFLATALNATVYYRAVGLRKNLGAQF